MIQASALNSAVPQGTNSGVGEGNGMSSTVVLGREARNCTVLLTREDKWRDQKLKKSVRMGEFTSQNYEGSVALNSAAQY